MLRFSKSYRSAQNSLFSISLVGLLSSCASNQNSAPAVDVSKTTQGTYALFSFSIEASKSLKPKCKIIFNRKSKNREVEVYELPSGSWALVPLSAGSYSYDNIDCGFSRRYLITNPFGKKQNEFSILPGKINYLGHTTLSFDSKDELNLKFDQKNHAESIKALFQKLPTSSWAHSNIISAYTQRSIRSDMMSFEVPRSYSIKSEAPKEEQERLRKFLTLIQNKITSCAETEAKQNPLKIGALELSYALKNDTLQEVSKKEKHVYSKSFVSCVQKALASTQYSATYPVSLDMKL